MSSSKKCSECKRKTPMCVTCKCERTLCFECRYPEDHECTFDYRAEQKEKLVTENPVVKTEKLQKV